MKQLTRCRYLARATFVGLLTSQRSSLRRAICHYVTHKPSIAERAYRSGSLTAAPAGGCWSVVTARRSVTNSERGFQMEVNFKVKRLVLSAVAGLPHRFSTTPCGLFLGFVSDHRFCHKIV